LRFDLLLGVGEGVGEAFFRFADAVGDGVGVDFFVECFRCLRLGVVLVSGSRTFLIFDPNDSSAEGAASTAPNKSTRIKSHFIIRRCSVRCPQRRIERANRVGCAETAHATPTDHESPREFLKDCFVQTNTAFEIFERKILVRRVSATIRQGESQ
jgi:hypothetical protein